jgi:hypothetical protein
MTKAVEASLERLRERGWTLAERRVFTLRLSSLHSFHGEELEDVICRAEAREAGTAKRPKPPTEQWEDTAVRRLRAEKAEHERGRSGR